MTPIIAFLPDGGQMVHECVAAARKIMRDLRQNRVYVIFNEVPLLVKADNDVEIDEVWRRHMKLREDAHR